MILGKLLEKKGFTVCLCENGEEAVEVAMKTRFSAILMDNTMPVMVRG
jgi:CheY-like chemotaxis protein